MRFAALFTLATAASAAVLREVRPLAGVDALEQRQAGPALPARHPHAAPHAARRSSGHSSGLRKVRRRKRQCRPRPTSTAPAASDSGSASAVTPTDSYAAESTETSMGANLVATHGGSSQDDWSSSSSTYQLSDKTQTKSSSGDEWSSSTATDAYPESATAASSSSSSSTDDNNSSATTTAAGSSSTGSSGSVSALWATIFPAGQGSADWTTCSSLGSFLSFSEALTPLQSGNLPQEGNDSGETVHIQTYPAGGIGGSTGMDWYTLGDKNSVSTSSANELLFTYSVKFVNFDWVKGGKLPGLYGGTSFAAAKSCSGGRQDGRDTCFSTRLMWRENGKGEIYNYLPQNSANSAYCSTPPMSACNPQYGDSVGRGAWTFPNNEWTVVSQRVKLNDVGQANGEQEVFINGASVLKLTGLELRVDQGTSFYGIMAQSFFGGGDSSYAPSSDQTAHFKDYSLTVLS